MKKGYTALDNEIMFSDLSDTAIRMYLLLKYFTDTNPNYEITRSGMEQEWKKLKNKTSKRTFVRAWNELKASGLLYKYDIRRGGFEGFGCRWGLRKSHKDTKKSADTDNNTDGDNDSPLPQNAKVQKKKAMIRGENKRLKDNKTKDCLRQPKNSINYKNSLREEVQTIFDDYINLKCKQPVKITHPTLHTDHIVSSNEIASQFAKCKEQNTTKEILDLVVDKVLDYIDTIQHKISYIVATIYNTINEYTVHTNKKRKPVKREKIMGTYTIKNTPNKSKEMSIDEINQKEKTNTTNDNTVYATDEIVDRAVKKIKQQLSQETKNFQRTTMPMRNQEKPLTKFHNFEQRDTDYDKLLKELREGETDHQVIDAPVVEQTNKVIADDSKSLGKYINEFGETIIDGINVDACTKKVCISDTLINRIKKKEHLTEMDRFMLGIA